MDVGDLVYYTEENSTLRILAMVLEPPNDVGNIKLIFPSGRVKILSSTRISLLPSKKR